MSKERELLKRWLAGEANQIPTHVPLLIETQNLLAQPEAIAPPKREPLSTDTMLRLISEHQDFPLNLARAVERECGIGGGE